LNPVNKLKVGKREKYQGSLNEEQKEMMLGQIGKLDDSELELLFNEVLNPIDCNFVLSDKQIDEQCEIMSKIISKSINTLRY
jgi:spore protease